MPKKIVKRATRKSSLKTSEASELRDHVASVVLANRVANKRTQQASDQLCGFPDGTIAQIEGGRRAPGVTTLRALVLCLGIKPTDILGCSEDSRGRVLRGGPK